MATYSLVVAQYTIDGHPRRTEHWRLLAILPDNQAQVYELVGNYDTFIYKSSRVHRFTQSRRLCGGCAVGQIQADRLGWLEVTLDDVQVTRNNEDFDCQTWVMNAIWHLKTEATGIINSNVNERFVRQILEEEREKWEKADDTMFDR